MAEIPQDPPYVGRPSAKGLVVDDHRAARRYTKPPHYSFAAIGANDSGRGLAQEVGGVVDERRTRDVSRFVFVAKPLQAREPGIDHLDVRCREVTIEPLGGYQRIGVDVTIHLSQQSGRRSVYRHSSPGTARPTGRFKSFLISPLHPRGHMMVPSRSARMVMKVAVIRRLLESRSPLDARDHGVPNGAWNKQSGACQQFRLIAGVGHGLLGATS